MVDVFLSYSRKDKDVVARLARAIEDEGYDVWWDAELPPHQSYGDVITGKITEAKAAIVVWSDSAAASEWVRAEADMARNQRKLVQTALGDIMPPLPFNQIQYADIGDWQGEDDHPSWRKVKASLADLCGRDGPDESIASAHEPAYAPSPAPAPAPIQEPEPDYAEPPAASSKMPLLAGLGIGALLLVSAAALFMMQGDGTDGENAGANTGQMALSDGEDTASSDRAGDGIAERTDEGNDSAAPPANRPDIPENWILATVEDADGHSNVRERPSTSSAIVGKVQVGETFRARREPGKWWPVELSDGTKGYVARRLIRVRGSDDPQTPSASDDDFILAGSSDRTLKASEVAPLSEAQLRIARNEIYARKGKIFQAPDLQAHFGQFNWYQPVASEVTLSPIEQNNVALIQSYENTNDAVP
jgi:hypothetical protein